MEIGIGLPNNVAGVPATIMVEWARRAEERGFESLTTIDRLLYPSLDSLIALALAAGATRDMTLVTNILLAPLYPTPVLIKQVSSLALAVGGRFVTGLGVGSREDDYIAAGVDFADRGARFDRQLTDMDWALNGAPRPAGAAITPAPVGIPLLIGGRSAATVRRACTTGDGWAGGALRDYAWQSKFVDRVRREWQLIGRRGDPLTHMSVNFALGAADIAEAGRMHLSQYYGFKPDFAQLNVDDLITSPTEARETVRIYRDLGFDRLLFHPAVASLDQVDRLADAVL